MGAVLGDRSNQMTKIKYSINNEEQDLGIHGQNKSVKLTLDQVLWGYYHKKGKDYRDYYLMDVDTGQVYWNMDAKVALMAGDRFTTHPRRKEAKDGKAEAKTEAV